jgi:hypothetical protein
MLIGCDASTVWRMVKAGALVSRGRVGRDQPSLERESPVAGLGRPHPRGRRQCSRRCCGLSADSRRLRSESVQVGSGEAEELACRPGRVPAWLVVVDCCRIGPLTWGNVTWCVGSCWRFVNILGTTWGLNHPHAFDTASASCGVAQPGDARGVQAARQRAWKRRNSCCAPPAVMRQTVLVGRCRLPPEP